MTVIEIAELCGVRKQTVINWINKTATYSDKSIDSLSPNFGLRNKLNNGSPENPSDFTLEETIAIIRDGGKNKTLASLLAENAASKNAISVNTVKGAGLPANFEERLSSLVGDIIDKKLQAKASYSVKDYYSQKDLARLSKARKLINNAMDSVVDFADCLLEPQDSPANCMIDAYNLLSFVLNKKAAKPEPEAIIEKDLYEDRLVLSIKNEDDGYPFQIGVNRAKLLKAALESEPDLLDMFIAKEVALNAKRKTKALSA